MITYKDSIVAVGRRLRSKAGEPRRYEVAAFEHGERDGVTVTYQYLKPSPDQ